MIEIKAHAMLAHSVYDESYRDQEGLEREIKLASSEATKALTEYVRLVTYKRTIIDIKHADRAIREAVPPIARQFWSDLVYKDFASGSVKVKSHLESFVGPLEKVNRLMTNLPKSSRVALEEVMISKAESKTRSSGISLEKLISHNINVAESAKFIIDATNSRQSQAFRFETACLHLVELWEEIYKQPFPKTVETVKIPGSRAIKGFDREFTAPAANFVFHAINAMDYSTVKPAKVERGLKAALKGRKGKIDRKKRPARP